MPSAGAKSRESRDYTYKPYSQRSNLILVRAPDQAAPVSYSTSVGFFSGDIDINIGPQNTTSNYGRNFFIPTSEFEINGNVSESLKQYFENGIIGSLNNLFLWSSDYYAN